MKRLFIFTGLVSALLLGSATLITAQTSCIAYPSNSTPPAGYGASWNVFSSAKELLVKVNCPTQGTALTMTIGGGDANQYVWNESYVYYLGAWQKKILQGTQSDGWIAGSGTASITAPANASAANPYYYVGYVCTNRGVAGWKCGCKDQSCATSMWQIQAYTGTSGGGTTGGTTGGTGGWSGGEFNPPQFYETVKNNAAKLCYSPDSTRPLQPGTNAITQGGTAANPAVYVPSGSFSGGTLTISAPYVILKGGTFNGTAIKINASNVRLTENTINAPYNGQAISTAYSARNVRIDRNIINAGQSSTGEDIRINIADGASTPYYHRIDHNLFTGGTPGDDGGLNVYLGLVNKQRESISRTLVERNYVDNSGRKYGFYLKSMENVIENNVINGGESRTGVRHGGRNVFFKNYFKGNTGFFSFDFDNYFVSNIAEGTRQGFWAGSGDCTFGTSDFACLPDDIPPGANHGQAVRTKLWGNKFAMSSDKFRIGYLEYNPRRTPHRCPEGMDISGNSDTAVGSEGCSAPASQNVNTSVAPSLASLSKSQVGPNGEADSLCN